MRGLFRIILLCLLLMPFALSAQSWQWKTLTIPAGTDTLRFDSLSTVPSSFRVFDADGNLADPGGYYFDPVNSRFFSNIPGDSVTLFYQTFPLNFQKTFRHRVYYDAPPDVSAGTNIYQVGDASPAELFETDGLTKNGSVSRGVTFGNNQDLTVNSNLDLKLSGKVSENINILAAISDDNIPIQPEGNTQQLQDFDQVYIQLFDHRNSLVAGDFQLTRPPGYFMTFYKRAQGAKFSTIIPASETDTSKAFTFTASGAVSKGKFARNIIQGIEGSQGPYRLRGTNNELFIIILSGTERVFIDGELLVRGQDNDYVIDYNTAEITFTAKRLITKDKRIVAEFQYTDRTYARSLLYSSGTYTSKNSKVFASFYNEQDSRNQPLQQDLDQRKKSFLAGVGDDISGALFPSIDTATFRDDLVLYALRDTLVNGVFYDSVLVFSNNPDSALYSASFSLTGEGRGNYRLENSTANGKVFRWIAPVGGIPQGDYEPVVLLITPKKFQMATLGGSQSFGEKLEAGAEVSYTDNDQNTFSQQGNGDNQDIAFRTWIKTREPDKVVKNKWLLSGNLLYEQVNKNFAPIERFRPVEFERDWNIQGREIETNQRLAQASAGLGKSDKGSVLYSVSAFHADTTYLGLKHDLVSLWNTGKVIHSGYGSALFSEGFDEKTTFLRWRSRSQVKGKLFSPGLAFDAELNTRSFIPSDSMIISSYQYHEWEIFASQPDSAINNYLLSYKQRSDYLPRMGDFKRNTFAETWAGSYQWNHSENVKTTLTGTYRTLVITDSTLTSQKPEETFLGRVENSVRALKGVINWDVFYETGSGLEQKKEFTYVEVAPGQGVYAYLGDLNGNGLKDLNEFEIARFQDQARYLRVFTPTLEYIRAYSTQLSQSLLLSPERVWLGKKGIRGLTARFASQTAFRVDRKTTRAERSDQFNPFAGGVADSNLVSTASSLRNILFFNRTSQVYGFEHSWQEALNKILLVNGFETRSNRSHNLRGRYNITRRWMISAEGEKGEKSSSNQFSASRNFDIGFYKVSPKLTFQPGTFLRTAVSGVYQEKQNASEAGGEELISRSMVVEFRYSKLTNGNLTLDARYVLNGFSGLNGTLVAYEMLEGLQPGKNITWNLLYQRQISRHLQLNLSYQGRISELSPAVHTGGVQVRAFF